MSNAFRQTHRWVSAFFMVTVVLNIVVMSIRPGQPPAWITYAPLLPLFVLMGTGTYLFCLPYFAKRG